MHGRRAPHPLFQTRSQLTGRTVDGAGDGDHMDAISQSEGASCSQQSLPLSDRSAPRPSVVRRRPDQGPIYQGISPVRESCNSDYYEEIGDV